MYFYTPPGCERGVNHRPLDFIQQKCRLTIRTHESRYARCRSHLSQSRGTFTNAHRIVSCAAPKSNLGIAKHHVNENLPNPAVQGMSVSSPANSSENACELHLFVAGRRVSHESHWGGRNNNRREVATACVPEGVGQKGHLPEGGRP